MISSQKKDLRKWISNIQSLNVCSQKGLAERFDSTVGASTVLLPYGGKYQLTPAEGMAAKIPVLKGETNTATLMTYGFNPEISQWSPFHGAVYAVIEAAAKITAMGGDYSTIRLTLQEYFERLGDDPKKWGKPFAALLGALYAQEELGIPAIGGKDSMSGTFEELNVPPTLVAFAVALTDANCVLSPEFTSTDSTVVLVELDQDENDLPDFEQLSKNYKCVRGLAEQARIRAAHSIRSGGIAEAISKMCLGNKIGFAFETIQEELLFKPLYGSILLELSSDEELSELFGNVRYTVIGRTQKKEAISIKGDEISLTEIQSAWESPLEAIFPTQVGAKLDNVEALNYQRRSNRRPAVNIASPRVFIPVFPGTNCEYDTMQAFEKAGGRTDVMVIKNLTSREIDQSIEQMAERIKKAQILMLPGGFSGDEPVSTGRIIATAFQNSAVKDAVMELLEKRDGLVLGIGSGFQALLKLGLIPFGEIGDLKSNSASLTINNIGRHLCRMVQIRVASVLSP